MDLVHQAHEARKKARELLEQAKREVEKLIEDKSQKSTEEVL
jgi:F0F1-type ATP synthase membrane subunit b/b'